ncbi:MULTISPECIES: class I SAM-dependent methyltransferase [unclassified Clostridioides]|uniref:class I SAM-dependent methyltransferase n=2 Tax=Clostridioides TaxID=1870884 RepID=UPI001D102B63
MESKYTEINSKTFDKWNKEGWEWGQPISHEVFERAKAGDWSVVLTPTKPVPKNWFCDMKNTKILGLASGGGQQMPIFTALGAQCTVLDYSTSQLLSEKKVAEREKYSIELVQADMAKPLPFKDESFDLIFHPVSNCYVEDVLPIWKECYRILKKVVYFYLDLIMASILYLMKKEQNSNIGFHLILKKIKIYMMNQSKMIGEFNFLIQLKNK